MRIHWLMAVLGAAATSGCIQGERAIYVSLDGSGRIVDTVKQTGRLAGDPSAEMEAREARLRATAAMMGPGVRLDSFEVAADGTETIAFAFEDVSKVAISEGPWPSHLGRDTSPGGDWPYRFRLERDGDRATLIVLSHRPADGEGAVAPPEIANASDKASQLANMSELVAGGRARTTLTVEGAIEDADTPHRQASTITLLDIDFDAVRADLENLWRLSSRRERPRQDVLAEFQGITTHTGSELTVRFRRSPP